MVKIYRLLRSVETHVPYGHRSFRNEIISQHSSRKEAEQKLEELKKITSDYCRIDELSIPKDVVEQALKITLTSQ